ncbi:hypothetical protein [Ruegeria jejuensis]|uniref:hypothetical protein n=1 Tax=Ruegeria jejuensis TaxID=3233338 RepID=UPI00355B5426
MRARATEPPSGSLIDSYASKPGFYTDCFSTEISGHVTFEDYLSAFYGSWLFRLERLILRSLLKVPTSDRDLSAYITGDTNAFAVWRLEQRQDNQMIAKAVSGSNRTRSWFLLDHESQGCTRLYFGSVLEPAQAEDGERPRLGLVFRIALPAHKLYSICLLNAAARRLARLKTP